MGAGIRFQTKDDRTIPYGATARFDKKNRIVQARSCAKWAYAWSGLDNFSLTLV